jgi:hypothetical protein
MQVYILSARPSKTAFLLEKILVGAHNSTCNKNKLFYWKRKISGARYKEFSLITLKT